MHILPVCLSPSWALSKSHLSACLSGGFPVKMVGNLSAKHLDWNSWLTAARSRIPRAYANKNPCLIYGPDTNHRPIQPFCHFRCLRHLYNQRPSDPSALSSDHLPVPIYTRRLSSLLNLPDCLDFRQTD